MSNKNFKNQNRHNYNQYAKKEETVKTVEAAETVEDTVEAVESVEDTVDEVEVTETIENADEATEAKVPIYGVVNCARLNIRRGPSIDTRPVTIVENGSELKIENFNDEWFKVLTNDGISGYCMKKFVDEK